MTSQAPTPPAVTRIVFVRQDTDGAGVGLFVVRADGGRERQITSAGSAPNIGADWSPRHEIVFSRHVSPDARGSRRGSFGPTGPRCIPS